MRDVLFVVVVFSTFFCAAINAYTYQIAYPLWGFVGRDAFAAVHREYLRRLDWIITVPHVLMFFSAALMIWLRPVFVGLAEAIVLFGLEAAVVGVSAFAAGPIHGRFTRTGVCDETGLRLLVRISALRVVLMAAACGLLVRWLLALLTR
jgi:hypothetical protein